MPKNPTWTRNSRFWIFASGWVFHATTCSTASTWSWTKVSAKWKTSCASNMLWNWWKSIRKTIFPSKASAVGLCLQLQFLHQFQGRNRPHSQQVDGVTRGSIHRNGHQAILMVLLNSPVWLRFPAKAHGRSNGIVRKLRIIPLFQQKTWQVFHTCQVFIC